MYLQHFASLNKNIFCQIRRFHFIHVFLFSSDVNFAQFFKKFFLPPFLSKNCIHSTLKQFYTNLLYKEEMYEEWVWSFVKQWGIKWKAKIQKIYILKKSKNQKMVCTVRSLSEASKRTAYMQVLFDVSERERTVVIIKIGKKSCQELFFLQRK